MTGPLNLIHIFEMMHMYPRSCRYSLLIVGVHNMVYCACELQSPVLLLLLILGSDCGFRKTVRVFDRENCQLSLLLLLYVVC
jgi:hypothetical protein